MGRIASYLLLAACIVVGYQGYENAREAPARAMGEGLAMQTACEIHPQCVVSAGPTKITADITRRRYLYRTSHGLVVVTCTRDYVFFGDWSCTSERGTF
ncbi:MAG: hypothetical protein D6705_12770 [Deltaproteobacteria bacterium]|nr:MAG: hypothetical protein D6705_12770 [Deltaproteobacteria bacterium]